MIWFNALEDVFVHIFAVARSGLDSLREEQRVSFQVRLGRDGRTSPGELAAIG